MRKSECQTITMAEEEGLTPYQDWTAGELKSKGAGLDVGMRSGHRETAPKATLTQADSAGALPRRGAVEVAGETREQRELRMYVASGEAKAALEAKKKQSDRPGSVRPGSERPGSERQGSSRPGSERPGSERFADKKKTGGGAAATGAPQSEKSKRKEMFKNF